MAFVLARRRLLILSVCGAVALMAAACAGGDAGGAGSEPTTAAPSTGTMSPTPTEDPVEELTPEESEWLGMASAVGPAFVSEALNAIARDRDDEGTLSAATDAESGPIEDAVPEEAPGRFANAHAALLVAREELVAFRDAGLSRAETGTEYDALLAGYEQAIIEWAAIVGVEVSPGG